MQVDHYSPGHAAVDSWSCVLLSGDFANECGPVIDGHLSFGKQ